MLSKEPRLSFNNVLLFLDKTTISREPLGDYKYYLDITTIDKGVKVKVDRVDSYMVYFMYKGNRYRCFSGNYVRCDYVSHSPEECKDCKMCLRGL
jgi:hypothetical protein